MLSNEGSQSLRGVEVVVKLEVFVGHPCVGHDRAVGHLALCDSLEELGQPLWRVRTLILHRLARGEVGARPPFWTAPHCVSSAVRKMMRWGGGGGSQGVWAGAAAICPQAKWCPAKSRCCNLPPSQVVPVRSFPVL